MKKKFTFLFPVIERASGSYGSSKSLFRHLGDLEVSGQFRRGKNLAGSSDNVYDYTINAIQFDGKDISPLVEAFSSMADIHSACVNYLEGLPGISKLATIIQMPARTKKFFQAVQLKTAML